MERIVVTRSISNSNDLAKTRMKEVNNVIFIHQFILTKEPESYTLCKVAKKYKDWYLVETSTL